MMRKTPVSEMSEDGKRALALYKLSLAVFTF